jgi:hypothetical protein
MSYNTDNIAIAAALRVYGHQIQQVEIEGRRATFIFNSSVEGEAEDIHMGRKLVDAISFHQELRRLSGLAKSMSQKAE